MRVVNRRASGLGPLRRTWAVVVLRASARQFGERGQAVVLTAIALPVIALATLGVVEWGQTYAQATQTQRAAQAAAEAVAQQLTASDMAQGSPPGWATGVATGVVQQMLPQVSSVVVSWTGGQQLPARPGPPVTANVPVQTLAPGSTTFNWAHADDVTFQLPSYGYVSQPRWNQTVFNYWDEATVGAWTSQWVSGSHGYWDSSLVSGGWPVGVTGNGCVVSYMFPSSYPYETAFAEYNWVTVWGDTGGTPFVAWSGTNWDWRGTGGYGGGVGVPWNWQSWTYRGAWSNPWLHWDRWLQQVGTFPWTNSTDSAGGSATVGPYSAVTGMGTTQGTVSSQAGYRTQFVQVTVRSLVRAFTPLFGAILPRQVTRVGVAQAAQ